MFETWLLNALNLFFPLVATLLILISQRSLLRVTSSYGPGEQKEALQRHHQKLSIAIALLAAWLLIQYLPLIYP